MSNYKGILTNKGKELLANATMGNRVNFSHLALGDGNGSVPTLNESRTSLVKERHRLALNSVDINPNNRNQIVCETIIPTNVGGFTVRELGLYVGKTWSCTAPIRRLTNHAKMKAGQERWSLGWLSTYKMPMLSPYIWIRH